MILRTRFKKRSLLSWNRGGSGTSDSNVMAITSLSAAVAPFNMNTTQYTPALTLAPNQEKIVDEDPKVTRPWNPRGEHYVYQLKYNPAILTGAPIRLDYYDSGLPPRWVGGSTACWCSPSFPSWAVPWATILDSLCQQAQGFGKQNSLLLVTLKELGETVNMLRNPYGLLKIAKMKRPKQPLPFAVAKKLGNVLLETTFGWKSLYNDIGAIAKSSSTIYRPGGLASGLAELDERFSGSTKFESVLPTVYTGGLTGSTYSSWKSNFFPTPGRSVCKVDRSYVILPRVNATLLTNTMGRLKRSQSIFKLASAFGLTNWKQYRDFLWEVVPYSFVLDWFVDSHGIWDPIVRQELARMNLTHINHSLKTIFQYKVECKSPAWSWPSTTWQGKYPDVYKPLVLSGIGSAEIFTRSPGFPPATQPPLAFNSQGLSLMQYALSGALAIQRLV